MIEEDVENLDIQHVQRIRRTHGAVLGRGSGQLHVNPASLRELLPPMLLQRVGVGVNRKKRCAVGV